MPWVYAAVAGSVLGVAMGYIAGRLPIAPILQSLGAAITAAVLGALTVGLLWFLRPPQSRGVGLVAISIGPETLLFLVGLGVCVALLHIGLGLFSASRPALALHRAVVLGCLGGSVRSVADGRSDGGDHALELNRVWVRGSLAETVGDRRHVHVSLPDPRAPFAPAPSTRFPYGSRSLGIGDWRILSATR